MTVKRNEIGSKNRYSTPALIALWFALVLSLVCSPAFTDEHDGNTPQQFSPESTTDSGVESTNTESEPEIQTSGDSSNDVTTGVSANKAKPQVRTLPPPRSNLSHGKSRDNTGNWRYALKPEDNVWTVAESFLNQRYSWVDLVRFNQIKDPNQVKTGNTLLIPISWLKVQPAPAKALSVSGEALLKRSQQRTFDPIVKNTLLNVGDTLRTLNGSILVQFADGSVLRVEENTTLIF
ncbi:MAG: LysM peptidoglycan-binding domain-containing protein, partial [Pseudomonadales bacterium]|nr:LysM peptidoglycan-binding domain-containing protein [Pseudomonadales bacterium]